MNYDRNTLKTLDRAGFIEKQVVMPDGTVLNYGEGPDNGIPLLLIHGQMTSWENYVKVLPRLYRHSHVYTVDCHGHGKSSKNVDKYTAEKMGTDFIWFIENVIKQPVIISGHSSGGLLTACIAANSPENVLGIVIEDAPFFSTEPPRNQKTFAWVDGFRVVHEFHNQDKEKDYVRFYLENCYLQTFFGDSWTPIKNYAFKYMDKKPDKKLRIFFLPPSMNKAFDLLTGPYDLKFGETFYDYSWFDNFSQAETLIRIKCPSIFIHTNWEYDKNGILLGALDADDAQRVNELITENILIRVKSGHNFHDEEPKDFSKILINFINTIKPNK